MADTYTILIVEDDALIAMELGERLADMGFDVLGPARTLAEAEAALASARPDAALLDVNVAGQSSVALGVELAARGVPVAFCTGYDRIKDLPPELSDVLVIAKPIGDADLAAGLKRLLG
jgi:DNA-binding response OmpR family regulator